MPMTREEALESTNLILADERLAEAQAKLAKLDADELSPVVRAIMVGSSRSLMQEPAIVMAPGMVDKAVVYLRGLIDERLKELGVE